MNWDCDFGRCVCSHVSLIHSNERHHLVWYEVPRCASTSIKHTLGLFKPCEKEKVDDIPEDWFSFAVVRDPWKRVVSNYLMVSSPKMKKSRFVMGRTLFGRIESFEDFVIRMFDEGCRNHHWAPCVRFLPKDLTTLDFVLRFETLHKDWEELRIKTGRLDRIGRRGPPNAVAENERNYAEFYKDSKIVDLVAEYYAEDIEAFGYEFGSNPAG